MRTTLLHEDDDESDGCRDLSQDGDGDNPLYRRPRSFRRSMPGFLPSTPGARRGSEGTLAISTPLSGPPPSTPAMSAPVFFTGTGEFLQTDARIYAQQITLMDFEAFAKIEPEELRDLGFSKKAKAELAPNVTRFTQRFNQLSSWLIDEILRHESVHDRSKALNHCIKLAKCLREVNNIHGLLAVASSLRSASIHRLKRSWNGVESKRKRQFDILESFISKDDNYEQLRTHVASCKPPCIPYLGIYKMDLLHLEVAEGDQVGCRRAEADKMIAAVLKFQETPYTYAPIPVVQERMLATEYPSDDMKAIKELEDRAFARSQEVEPRDKPKTLPYPSRTGGGSFQLPTPSASRDDSVLAPGRMGAGKKGHRKAKSLGNALVFASECLLPDDNGSDVFDSPPQYGGSIDTLLVDPSPTPSPLPPLPVLRIPPSSTRTPKGPNDPSRHSTLSTFSLNAAMLAGGQRTPSVQVTDDDIASPLDNGSSLSEDDDDADPTTPHHHHHHHRATGSNGSPLSAGTSPTGAVPPSHGAGPAVGVSAEGFLHEGELQRKRGSSRLTSYKHLWVGLTKTHLVFFARRDKGSGRAAYSDVPFKMKSIYGAVLMIGDPNLDRKFALRMHSGKLLQFKADSAKARSEWLVALRSCLGISASDVVQMETTMTPPVRRRVFGVRKKTPQTQRRPLRANSGLHDDEHGRASSAPVVDDASPSTSTVPPTALDLSLASAGKAKPRHSPVTGTTGSSGGSRRSTPRASGSPRSGSPRASPKLSRRFGKSPAGKKEEVSTFVADAPTMDTSPAEAPSMPADGPLATRAAAPAVPPLSSSSYHTHHRTPPSGASASASAGATSSSSHRTPPPPPPSDGHKDRRGETGVRGRPATPRQPVLTLSKKGGAPKAAPALSGRAASSAVKDRGSDSDNASDEGDHAGDEDEDEDAQGFPDELMEQDRPLTNGAPLRQQSSESWGFGADYTPEIS
eukprot:m.83347 g.83347  ORF g.83347 m.83347 type:complete len:967 (+) comp9532_c0_seq2:152-3052(+)